MFSNGNYKMSSKGIPCALNKKDILKDIEKKIKTSTFELQPKIEGKKKEEIPIKYCDLINICDEEFKAVGFFVCYRNDKEISLNGDIPTLPPFIVEINMTDKISCFYVHKKKTVSLDHISEIKFALQQMKKV